MIEMINIIKEIPFKFFDLVLKILEYEFYIFIYLVVTGICTLVALIPIALIFRIIYDLFL